jgi:hypothetical protein
MRPTSWLSKVLLSLALAAALAAPGLSEAATGGRERGVLATYVFHAYYELPAGQTITIETQGLSAGADTVLHVQDVYGNYLDGNDDCATRNNTCTGLRSWLTLPASPAIRGVLIIVRAYSDVSGGSATLVITPSLGSPTYTSFEFASGYKRWFPSFQNAGHFMTVEEMGGSSDTLLLVTSDYPGRAISYDDDNGVGRMSWTHVNEDCTFGCTVIVAAYHPNNLGTTTLLWDDSLHTADCDSDGMSDVLEASIGTLSCNNDTDGDGLKDGEELMGLDRASNLLRLPMYGADPLVKDLFVETDWKPCVPAGPNDFSCGDPQNPNANQWQMPAAEALKAAGIFAPDVALHIDTGAVNLDPSTWHTYNNWLGAGQVPYMTGDKCEWLQPDRVGFFHAARLDGSAGNQSVMPGSCFDSSTDGRAFSHELGHNMNLSHGGQQSGGIDMNCKPNYRSIMSYALTYDSQTRFSRGEFSSITLNPSMMNELSGLGTTDQALLTHLQTPSFRYAVDSATGAVDWNRDGQFSSGLVRAAATWGWGFGGCDIPTYQANTGVTIARSGNALAWLNYQGTTPRLYWFTRRDSDAKLEYRFATSFPENCGSPPPATCKTPWSPAVGTSATSVPSSVAGKGAPAVAPMRSAANVPYLVLVYKDSQDKLRYQLFNGTWSAVEYVGLGAEGITGEIAAVEQLDGNVAVYAVTGSGTSARLKLWIFDRYFNWYWGGDQLWADGTPIVPAYGIGLTRGYLQQQSGPVQVIAAAIPMASPLGAVEMAWKAGTALNWTRLDDGRWHYGKAYTHAPPAIAYVPFDRDVSVSEGRFYLAWNGSLANGERQPARMTQTEGNSLVSTTSRRMRWTQESVFFWNQWHHSKGNMTLLYDLLYDRNLRAANTYDWDGSSPQINFFPVADGIFNGDLRDQDDYNVIRSNLRCALNQGSCL